MKPIPLSLFLLISSAAPAWAQNLVPNPSFEDFQVCPDDLSQMDRAFPWGQPTEGTCDFFHSCTPNPAVSVPDNWAGEEEALDGNGVGEGYAGLITFSDLFEYREYLEAPLDQPLLAGKKYRVTFYVSHGEMANFATGALGAYLSVGSVGPVASFESLDLDPQVVSNPLWVIIQDDGWYKVTGWFIAAGGEDHIVIGNFQTDAEIAIFPVNDDAADRAYYYVDDVSVRRIDRLDLGGTITFPPSNPVPVAEWDVTGAPPFSPAVLYWSKNLGGTEFNGQPFDIGPRAHVLATAVTTPTGTASFRLGGPRFRPLRVTTVPRTIYLEARVDDPTAGFTFDSNPLALSIQ